MCTAGCASPLLQLLQLLRAGPDFADWVCLGIGYVSMLGALAVAVWMGLSWAMLRGGRHRARLGAARGLLTASMELGRELHGKLMRSAGGLPSKLLSLSAIPCLPESLTNSGAGIGLCEALALSPVCQRVAYIRAASRDMQHKQHAQHVAGWAHLRPTSSGTPHHTKAKLSHQLQVPHPPAPVSLMEAMQKLLLLPLKL